MSRNKAGKKRIFAFLLKLILILIYFCSCASQTAAGGKQIYAYLTDNARYILLPPAEIEKNIDMAQHISASFQGQDYYLNAWVQAGETGMEITLLNDLGAAMGELSYREKGVHFASPVFPNRLKAEYIVADFQLCFYNPSMLYGALEKCGLLFENTEFGRHILEGDTVVIEIEKNSGSVKLVNHLRGYSYTLEGNFE